MAGLPQQDRPSIMCGGATDVINASTGQQRIAGAVAAAPIAAGELSGRPTDSQQQQQGSDAGPLQPLEESAALTAAIDAQLVQPPEPGAAAGARKAVPLRRREVEEQEDNDWTYDPEAPSFNDLPREIRLQVRGVRTALAVTIGPPMLLPLVTPAPPPLTFAPRSCPAVTGARCTAQASPAAATARC